MFYSSRKKKMFVSEELFFLSDQFSKHLNNSASVSFSFFLEKDIGVPGMYKEFTPFTIKTKTQRSVPLG